MNEFLWQSYHRLIAGVTSSPHRALYYQLDLTHRLTGIVGPRGVGKTTLLLQYIKENLYTTKNTFYFSADNIYFNNTSILEFVDELYRTQNIEIFFIDEIHKYVNWNQELKNIYDAFPNVKVVFSGSSSIDLIQGTYDLSRRARLLHLPGLSFREYLNIQTGQSFEVISWKNLLSDHQQLAAQLSQVVTVAKYFEEYMLFGYYPIVFQNRDYLYDAIANVIDKTIYEDIANFYHLKTENLNYFKRIVNFLATIPPGNVNINNLAKHLRVDNKTASHYLEILQRTGLINILYAKATGNRVLTKPEKIYLNNTTLLSAVSAFLSEKNNIGTQRELAFLQLVQGAGLSVFYSEVGDFEVNNIVIEVGGKNKTNKQLKSHTGKNILVKDDILIGAKNQIPLYLFGFLY